MATRTTKAPKADLNEATREELVEVAGIKPATADKIVKLREEGPIKSMEVLGEAAEIGKAELGKLRGTVEVAAEAARDVAEKGTQTVQRVGEAVQEQAGRTLDKASEVGGELAQRMAPVAQLGWLWASFWPEQMAQGVATAQRLAQCRSWPEIVQVQSEFALSSIDRLARRFASATQLAANQTDRLEAGRDRRAA